MGSNPIPSVYLFFFFLFIFIGDFNMASIVLGCDTNGNNEIWQNTVAKGLENAGYTVDKLPIASGPFGDSGYKSSAKGKIGIYLMAASLTSVTDLASDGWVYDYTYFIIRGDISSLIKSENDMGTKGVPKDHHGDCTNKYCDKWAGKTYNQINEIIKDKGKCLFASTPEGAVDVILKAISGVSTNSSSDDGKQDEDEEWDDKDNFTPHKGSIMEIRPYKEIASVSFEKSYDSPSGTGNIELLYASKDYKYIYKGVAMKLKLRRSSDEEWSATGVEEPNYNENEKFFKEHIPTNELLKELGLPNFRKQKILMNTSTDDESSDSTSSTTSNTSSNTSSSNNTSSNNTSNKTTSSQSNKASSKSKTSNPSTSKLRRLTKSQINSLSPQEAKELAKKTNEYDATTIKGLRRRALGLYW